MPLVAQASWRGRWLAEPRGEGGFGYDPHFLPNGQVLSAAQMEAQEKNRVSHRGRATRLLMSALGEAGFFGISTAASDAAKLSDATRLSDATGVNDGFVETGTSDATGVNDGFVETGTSDATEARGGACALASVAVADPPERSRWSR